MSRELRIGTSGWSYPSWRGVLYEAGVAQRRWLERYAEAFDSVELNGTFYRLPPEEQFASWRRRTPRGFAFAVKGSRLITHVKRLAGVEAALQTFFACTRRLGRKAAVTLWQLPPNLECDLARLADFCALLPRARSLRQAIEFRHPSWWREEVYALLECHGVALVLPDSASRVAMRAPVLRHTADFAYLRLHDGRGARGSYSAAQLRTWAERIAGWNREHDLYVYFNNDWEGFAVRNALRLKQLMSASDKQVAPGSRATLSRSARRGSRR
jgi:uncharacterized protein YecE (DUF72 family)